MKILVPILIALLLATLPSGLLGEVPKASSTPQITGFYIDPSQTDQCTPVRVGIALMNQTAQTLSSQMPYSGSTYSLYQSFVERGTTPVSGTYMFAVSLNGGLDGYPYRWGFRGQLAPGHTTTIMGYIVIPETGKYHLTGVLMNGESVVKAAGVQLGVVRVDACSPQQEETPAYPAENRYFFDTFPGFAYNPPLSTGSHILLPAPPLVYSMGGSLFFTGNGFTISSGGTQMTLFPGSPYAYVNGQMVILPVSPRYYGGQLYIPPRYVCPFFGSTIYYDHYTGNVYMQIP